MQVLWRLECDTPLAEDTTERVTAELVRWLSGFRRVQQGDGATGEDAGPAAELEAEWELEWFVAVPPKGEDAAAAATTTMAGWCDGVLFSAPRAAAS